MKKKVNIKMGLILALVAVISSSFGLYQIYLDANAKIKIPMVVCLDESRLNVPVLKAGDVIKKDHIVEVEVTRGSMLPYTVLNSSELIGNFVARDYYPYENFYYNSITTNYPQRLKEKIRYQAIAIPVSLISTVNGEISPDDFIKIDIILGSGAQKDVLSTNGVFANEGCQIIETDYLKAVRVIGMYEGDGSDAARIRDQNGLGTRTPISPSFLIVDVNTIQHPLLMYAKQMGSIEVTIIPESEQEAYRQAWGLSIDPNEITGSVDENVLSDIIAEDEKNSSVSIEDGNEIAKSEIEKATGQKVEGDIPTEDADTNEILESAENGPIEPTPSDTTSSEEPSVSEVSDGVQLEMPTEETGKDDEQPLALGVPSDDTTSSQDSSVLGATEESNTLQTDIPLDISANSNTVSNTVTTPISQSIINYKSLLQQMPDEYKVNLKQVPNDTVINVSGDLLSNMRVATQF